jgi:hypothetical protein
MQLSVIIPTWSGVEHTDRWQGEQKLADMAYELCQKLRPECDELIVTEDADVYDERLHMISDIYLLHPNLGFTNNVNLGLRVAHGDYMAVVNSDVELVSGNIRDLCVPGRVASPYAEPEGYLPHFHGYFFVLPRTVLEDSRYGYLDSTMRDLDSDHAYRNLTKDIFTHVPSVKIKHEYTSRSYKRRVYFNHARTPR